MMDIEIEDFHDHPLCEGKSEEEILSLYKELLGAYKTLTPHLHTFLETYKTNASRCDLYNGSFDHGLNFTLTYKDTQTLQPAGRKILITTRKMDRCFMMRIREIRNDMLLILKKAMANGLLETKDGQDEEPEEQEAPDLMVSKIAMPYVYIRLDADKMAAGINAPEKKRNWAVGFPKDNNAGDAWFEYLCKPGQFPSKINIGDFGDIRLRGRLRHTAYGGALREGTCRRHSI